MINESELSEAFRLAGLGNEAGWNMPHAAVACPCHMAFFSFGCTGDPCSYLTVVAVKYG